VLEHESVQRSTAREQPGVLEHESVQRSTAREQPGVLAHEARQRRMANANKHVVMATKFENGEYLFHQPCGSWDKECVHGCGYLHLSSSTAGTRKKCCANGRLSSVSGNFDKELMMKHELQQFPLFMRNIVTWSTNFSQKSSIYNNLVAMAGTVVCNYSDLNGWLRRGPGDQCVFMNGRVHHYMRIASSTAQNCGISYFIFDDIASLAGSADAQDVNPQILLDICKGLREENPYCNELRFLGAAAQERAEGIAVIPRMPDQLSHPHFDVCSVMNNRQTGEMRLQVETHTNRVSNICLDSEEVEGLCFPLLHCHGEPGYTNDIKSHMSPDEYVMARLLRPEKLGFEYMTAQAVHPPLQCIDSRTGEPFAPTELQSDIEEHQLEGVFTCRLLRVNCFMMMARVAQYWLMDFYSRVLDQRMSIIGKIKNRILMGQDRQQSDALNKHEEQDRIAAGYIDGPKKESYLPSSVHGSPRHMAALAKNSLVLVSEDGCPHAFLTLTCNPKWPEIVSQLLDGQTAFDRPDVTAAAFKSRLDQFKKNVRNGKYFDGR